MNKNKILFKQHIFDILQHVETATESEISDLLSSEFARITIRKELSKILRDLQRNHAITVVGHTDDSRQLSIYALPAKKNDNRLYVGRII